MLRVVFFLGVVAAATALNCKLLDYDFCQVHNSDCVWRYQTKSCELRGCWDYAGEENCRRDIFHFQDCEWDSENYFCQKSNVLAPCWSFEEDCPAERCTYDEQLGCLPKGVVPRCNLFYGDSCPLDRCALGGQRGELCMPKGSLAPCSDAYGVSCVEPRCEDNSDADLCWPRGLPIPCTHLFTEDTCDPARCSWVGGQRCYAKNDPIVCPDFFEEDYCPESECEWDSQLGFCWYKNEDVPCYKYGGFQGHACPVGRCRLFGVGRTAVCQPADVPIDCSSMQYNSIDCGPHFNCTGDCKNKICIPCQGAKCVAEACGAATEDQNLLCEQHHGEDLCTGDAQCQWRVDSLSCHSKDETTACADFQEYEKCIDDHGPLTCKFVQGMCIACNDDCKSQPPEPPVDTGKPCDQYIIPKDQCPYPRCFQQDVANAPSLCRNATCYDLQTPNDCSGKDGCVFSDDFALCLPKGERVPCFFFDQPDCNNQTGCKYNLATGFCNVTDTGKTPCSQLNWGDCPNNLRCSWDDRSQECKPFQCCDIFAPQQCQLRAGCQWSDSQFRCFSNDNQPCNTHNNECSCPADRCSWRPFDYTRWGCQDKLCEDSFTELECFQLKGCKWDDTGRVCFRPSSSDDPCSSFDANTCPGDRCEYSVFNEDTQTPVDPPACIPKTCASRSKQPDCAKGANCIWDKDAFTCFFDNGKPCSENSKETCPANRCDLVGSWATAVCKDKVCADFSTPEFCEAKTTCKWLPENYACVDKSQGIDCSRLSYEQCVGDCAYDPASSVCYNKKQGVPCESIEFEKECTTNKKCSWKTAGNQHCCTSPC